MDYESGKAIPNNQILSKLERALGKYNKQDCIRDHVLGRSDIDSCIVGIINTQSAPSIPFFLIILDPNKVANPDRLQNVHNFCVSHVNLINMTYLYHTTSLPETVVGASNCCVQLMDSTLVISIHTFLPLTGTCYS